jgi:hypothetical protein
VAVVMAASGSASSSPYTESNVDSRETIRDDMPLLVRPMELARLRLRRGLLAGIGGLGREEPNRIAERGGGGSILNPRPRRSCCREFGDTSSPRRIFSLARRAGSAGADASGKVPAMGGDTTSSSKACLELSRGEMTGGPLCDKIDVDGIVGEVGDTGDAADEYRFGIFTGGPARAGSGSPAGRGGSSFSSSVSSQITSARLGAPLLERDPDE